MVQCNPGYLEELVSVGLVRPIPRVRVLVRGASLGCTDAQKYTEVLQTIPIWQQLKSICREREGCFVHMYCTVTNTILYAHFQNHGMHIGLVSCRGGCIAFTATLTLYIGSCSNVSVACMVVLINPAPQGSSH